MPFFRFDGSCSKELYDNTYERFEKLYPEVNQNSDTGISGDGSISNFPDNMYQGWLDRQSAIRALHNDWDRIFNEEAEKLERRKKAEDEETKKQQEAERTQKELEKKRQKNFSSLVDEESTASLVESCPLKDKNEQDNDCTFESYSISFEYDAAKGQPLRGPFEFKKDAKDKVVETVCGFEDKYAIATIKVNDITKKKCAIPFRKQHFPNRMFDTSALEDEHILHQTEDTLKIKVFSEKMERPITGGVAGILDNYSQFLVWNYKPKPVCIPINTCGRKEVVEIRAYRDTNLNGYIKLGASQEETKAWNTKSKSFDLSSKLRILGPTFHGKIIYDSTELAFEVGFKTEGNKLKKICELASKVFDVAQQIGAETSPPGLKFSLIYPNLMLAVSDSSGIGSSGWKDGGSSLWRADGSGLGAGWVVDGKTQKCKMGVNITMGFFPFIGGEFEFKVLDAVLSTIPVVGPAIAKLKDKVKNHLEVNIIVKFNGAISGNATLSLHDKKATGQMSGSMEISVTAIAEGKLDVWKYSCVAGTMAEAKAAVSFPLKSYGTPKSAGISFGFAFSGLVVKAVAYKKIGKKDVTVEPGKSQLIDKNANTKELYKGVWVDPYPNKLKGEKDITLFNYEF